MIEPLAIAIIFLYAASWAVALGYRWVYNTNHARYSVAYYGPALRNEMPVEWVVEILKANEDLITHANEVLNEHRATIEILTSPPCQGPEPDSIEFHFHVVQHRRKLHGITSNADEIVDAIFGKNGLINLIKKEGMAARAQQHS